MYNHVAKTTRGLKGMVTKKSFVLPINLGFSLFSNFCFCTWFYMMSSSMQPLQFNTASIKNARVMCTFLFHILIN
jgi:hypothetical protein